MAARFWIAQPVSGAIVSVTSPPQVRLTVASTSGMTTGDVRTVFGVGGTTEANGTWTITVIDGTHIDLQGTTFANVYTSGGSVNGKWDASNTNNWVTTSGGSNYGQTVPGTGDTVTFNGSSGGGTVTVNTTVSVSSIVMGTFTGTLDFSANNNDVNIGTVTAAATAFDNTGTGTRTLNMGNGTWTLDATTTVWSTNTTTNLTFNANSSTIVVAARANISRGFISATLSFNNLTLNSASASRVVFTVNASTFVTITVNAPLWILATAGGTITTTNLVVSGSSSSAPVLFDSNVTGTTMTWAVTNGLSMSWGVFKDITFSGGAATATSSLDFGHNSGITITPPGGGGLLSQGEMMGGMVG